MKNLYLFLLIFFTSFECNAQRYDIWIGTSGNNYPAKLNYGFSTDSFLVTYSNPSWFNPSKQIFYNWDDVTWVKTRNRTKQNIGRIVGGVVGLIAYSVILNSIENDGGEKGLGFAMAGAPLTMGGGIIIGSILTSKKNEIPLDQLSSVEKNKKLNDTLKNKKKKFKEVSSE